MWFISRIKWKILSRKANSNVSFFAKVKKIIVIIIGIFSSVFRGYATPLNIKGNYFLKTNEESPYGINATKDFKPVCNEWLTDNYSSDSINSSTTNGGGTTISSLSILTRTVILLLISIIITWTKVHCFCFRWILNFIANFIFDGSKKKK